MNTVNNNFSIFKTDSDKRLVFGWASISITVNGAQLEDRQQDIIDPDDLEEAAYEYVLNFRDTGEEHNPTMRKKGKLVESCVLTAEKQKAMGIPEGAVPVGWWIGFKIEDDAAWERVKNGQYRMFSIEGKANREPVEKSGGPTGCGVLVVRDGKVLTGTRIERASRGQICGPGGHIEAGETPEKAAVREAHEEFGITCHDLKPLGTTPDGKSAIFMCSSFSGTPNTDEEEMTDIQWIAPEEIEEADAFKPFWESLKLLTIKKSRSSYDEYPSYSMWLEENLDATIEQQKAAKEYYQAHEKEAKRNWKWNPDRKDKPVAKTFADVLKSNPNHDRLGRFASAGSGSAPGASERSFKKPTEEDVKRLQAEMGPVDLSGANYFGTTGFRAVNEALRNNNPLDEKSQKTVDVLDKNMKPSPTDLSLDRFMFGGMFEALGLNAKVIESGDEAEASKAVGKILDNKGYTSTTYDAEQIPFPVLPGKTILMHINVPKGTNLLIRPDLKEAEILLARDTSVKINGVKKGSLGEWEVNCEVVPNAIGKSFDEVLKFNPYHDSHGRFASANSYASFSANQNTTAGRMSIERHSRNSNNSRITNINPAANKQRVIDQWKETQDFQDYQAKLQTDVQHCNRINSSIAKKIVNTAHADITSTDLYALTPHFKDGPMKLPNGDNNTSGYFQSKNSMRINQKIRENVKDGKSWDDGFDLDDQKTIAAMEKGMKPLSKGLQLRRNVNDSCMEGCGISAKDIQDVLSDPSKIKNISNKLLGEWGVCANYQSTGYDFGDTSSFSNRSVSLVINAPKGTKAFVSPTMMESEVVLARNTKIRYTGNVSVETRMDGTKYLAVEAVVDKDFN